MKKIILALLGGSVICLAPFGVKAAQTSYHGLSLSPAIEQLSINEGQSQLSYKIQLSNNLGQTVSIKVSTLDFKSLNETGGVAFIGNNASEIEHKYGLAKWIETPSGLITLPANGTQSVDIKIDDRADLTPGGHYAAILFGLVSPSTASNNHVEVDQVVSSLLFVRKSGGEIYGLNLQNITLHRNFAWLGWPTRLDTVFSNTGNVQTAPRGVIALSGFNTVLNPNSSLILPGSSRFISTDLNSAKPPFWPGRYMLALSYRPDGSLATHGEAVTFFYVGWKFLAALAILLMATLFGLPKRARQLVIRQLKKTVERLLSHGWWLIKKSKYLFIWLGKGILAFLVYLDYLGGVALLRWDKRRSKKRKRR